MRLITAKSRRKRKSGKIRFKKGTSAALAVLALVILICAFFPKIRQEYYKIIYPVKYSDIVEQQADTYKISKSLVLAVIKTESGFDADATSPVGAKGLMQMTDETFAWMQTEIDGEEIYQPKDLYTPEISIKYGCALLSKLIKYYDNTDIALCAYNAGMGNVSDWLENYGDEAGNLTQIPFPETESYLVKVHEAQKMYLEMYPDSST